MACNSEPSVTDSSSSNSGTAPLVVNLDIQGPDKDTNVNIVIDGISKFSIGTDQVRFTDLDPSTYELQIQKLPLNCSVVKARQLPLKFPKQVGTSVDIIVRCREALINQLLCIREENQQHNL